MAAEQRQRHLLSAAALVDSFGDGLYLAGAALFFTRGLGLTVTQAGLGLTVAGITGLSLSPELGRLADRRGPRRVFVELMLTQAVAVALLTTVRDLAMLIPIATVAVVCRQGSQASRGGIIAQLAGEDAPELRSSLHAVMNLGMSIGAALAAVAIAIDTPAAYRVLMLTNAGTFVVAALLATRLEVGDEAAATVAGRARKPRRALRDRTFLLLVALSVLLSLQFVVSGYLLPLWVSLHTSAPRWVASPLLLVNTALIVVFQAAFGRRVSSLPQSARGLALAGGALAVSFATFGAAGQVTGVVAAVAVLTVAMVVHSVAELFTVAATSVVSFRLAAPGAVSEYQGLWSLGFGLSVAIGPGLLTFACLERGTAGWVAVGLLMALTGGAMALVVLRCAGSVAADAPVETAHDLPVPTALVPDPTPSPGGTIP